MEDLEQTNAHLQPINQKSLAIRSGDTDHATRITLVAIHPPFSCDSQASVTRPRHGSVDTIPHWYAGIERANKQVKDATGWK